MSGGGGYPWWMEPTAAAGAAALRALGGTWRLERRGEGPRKPGARDTTPRIFALWHADLLTLMCTERDCGAAVLISRHADGEIAARAVERLGFQTVRGSSTRGGGRGLLEALRLAALGTSIAITPDGPHGPSEAVKPGIAYLASRSGLAVVPVAVGSPDPIRLRSWDGMRIPRPFARVCVWFGTPIAVAAELDDTALECARQTIEQSLRESAHGLRTEMGDRG